MLPSSECGVGLQAPRRPLTPRSGGARFVPRRSLNASLARRGRGHKRKAFSKLSDGLEPSTLSLPCRGHAETRLRPEKGGCSSGRKPEARIQSSPLAAISPPRGRGRILQYRGRSEHRPGAREVPYWGCMGSRGGRASWSRPAGRGRGAAPWIAPGGHGGGARSCRSPRGDRRGLRLVVWGHRDHWARARCVKSPRIPLRADARGGGIRDRTRKPSPRRARRARRYRRGR